MGRRPADHKLRKILQLMQLHELTAVNTLFAPPHGNSVHTYLHTKPKDGADEGDLGEFVGDKVVVTYRGKKIKGRVSATYAEQGTGRQVWVVTYEDGYVKKYVNRKSLEKILVYSNTFKQGKQLDYIMVSTRWKSCVCDCKPKWAPAHGDYVL